METIRPFLWFDNQAEDAARFYTSIFKNSRIINSVRYGKEGFEIRCDSQEEVDHYWNNLTEGGDVNAQQCGWLKDKFGVSWQVVPQALIDLMSDLDHEKAGRVMNTMLRMKKIAVAGLQCAYEGK